MRDELEDYLVDELEAGRIDRREFVRQATVIGLSGPVIGALLSATDAGAAPTVLKPMREAVNRGGTLRAGVTQPFTGLDPVRMYDEGAQATTMLVGEYLIWVDAHLVLHPRLATSWRPLASGRRWRFSIRKGVSFHDGTPLTAADVVASFDRITDPQIASPAQNALKGILSKGNTERIDDHTVDFHLDGPVVDFPYFVTELTYNSQILPKNYEVGSYEKKPVGTGPFMLVKYVPQESATLKKNPNYWRRGLPYLDAIQITYYKDTQAEVLGLQAKSYDVMFNTPFQGAQALLKDQNIKFDFYPVAAPRAIHMRTNSKPFNDKRVRQAFAFAMNRPQIIQALFKGHADIGNDNVFAPVFPTYVKIPQRRQNLSKAKELLRAAGYPNGVSFPALAMPGYLELPQYAQLVQSMAAKVGIRFKLNVMTPAAYYGSGKNQPWLSVPFGLTEWSPRGTPAALINPAYKCSGVWNSAHWCSAEFDRILARFNAEVDVKKRKKLARRLEEIQTDAVPASINYFVRSPRAMRKRVHGVGFATYFDLTQAWLS